MTNMNDDNEILIFHPITYKNLMAVGFSEEEARGMATQPEGANLHEYEFENKQEAVWGFAFWPKTKEGRYYWNNIADILEEE